MNNRTIIQIFCIVLLTVLPGKAFGFNPTYKHAVEVTAYVTPTGKGKVYVSQEKNDQETVTDGMWKSDSSVGGHSSNTSGADMPVFLYASPITAYYFEGWSLTSNGEIESTDNPYRKTYAVHSGNGNGTNKADIYARFAPTRYTITYNPDEGTVPGGNSQVYTIESTSSLAAPTKYGNAFEGWEVTEAEGSWNLNDTHAAGTSLNGKYGNVKLLAQWRPLPCDIIISVSGLQSNESAIFNVKSGSSVLYTVAVGSSPVTIKGLAVGEYTVEPTTWSWAYTMSGAQTKTLSYPNATFAFSATNPKSVKRDEKKNINWE